MRIVIITTGYYPSLHGASTSLYNRLKCFSDEGHRVLVIGPDYRAFAAVYPDHREHVGEILPGVTLVTYRSTPIFDIAAGIPGPVFTSFRGRAFARAIIDFHPDVIQVEEPERLFVTGAFCRAGLRLGRRLKIPVTAFYHTDYIISMGNYRQHIPLFRIPGMSFLLRKLTGWIYNSYDLTMVQSSLVERELVESFGITNCVRRDFLAVDSSRFNHRGTVRRIPFKGSGRRVRILYVGRLFPDKHIDDLLAVLDAVKRMSDNCFFIFIGNGLDEHKVSDWVAETEHSVFLGHIPNERTAAYYRSADIFVTASPNETFGLTVLEAMGCGLPVVGPDTGGVGDLVSDGSTGFTVNYRDIDAFAGAIVRLVDDRALRARMGRAARAAVRNSSWERSAHIAIDLWRGCIEGIDKLLITAHPDDETIFAGTELLRDPGWKVVCVTCGDDDVRRREFEAAMRHLGVKEYEHWEYPDRWEGDFDRKRLAKDLARVLGERVYRKVLTHNAAGEYGHTQHRALHEVVASLVDRDLFVFGEGQFPISPAMLVRKLRVLKHYRSQTMLLSDQDRLFRKRIKRFFIFERCVRIR